MILSSHDLERNHLERINFLDNLLSLLLLFRREGIKVKDKSNISHSTFTTVCVTVYQVISVEPKFYYLLSLLLEQTI